MKGQKENQVAVVIGGTSGLGLELARRLRETHSVVVTGRDDEKGERVARTEGFVYEQLHVDTVESATPPGFGQTIEGIEAAGQVLDTIVYAAGSRQNGHLDDLTEMELQSLLAVGLLAPIGLLQETLRLAHAVPNLIIVTSTAAFTAREKEQVYCATKAGLTAFAEAFSLDPRVGKTLVAAPAGMKTPFWDGSTTDVSEFLDPTWVADEIMKTWAERFAYREERYLRKPARTETAKIRL